MSVQTEFTIVLTSTADVLTHLDLSNAIAFRGSGIQEVLVRISMNVQKVGEIENETYEFIRPALYSLPLPVPKLMIRKRAVTEIQKAAKNLVSLRQAGASVDIVNNHCKNQFSCKRRNQYTQAKCNYTS